MKTENAKIVSYSDRFKDPSAVEAYNSREYAPDSYATCIWQIQRPMLEQLLKEFKRGLHGPLRLLDFACGTGRIVSCLEPLADVAEGVDISEKMVEVARRKCKKARLRVGDILCSPEILQERYDVITCFRFLLNADPETRKCVLRRLRQLMCDLEGLFLVNIHGNASSLRHMAILWKRWRLRRAPTAERARVMLNEMGASEARELLRESGFEVISQLGFGVMPPTFYRTPLRRLAAAIDRVFARRQWCKDWSIELLFVCRPNNRI